MFIATLHFYIYYLEAFNLQSNNIFLIADVVMTT